MPVRARLSTVADPAVVHLPCGHVTKPFNKVDHSPLCPPCQMLSDTTGFVPFVPPGMHGLRLGLSQVSTADWLARLEYRTQGRLMDRRPRFDRRGNDTLKIYS